MRHGSADCADPWHPPRWCENILVDGVFLREGEVMLKSVALNLTGKVAVGVGGQ